MEINLKFQFLFSVAWVFFEIDIIYVCNLYDLKKYCTWSIRGCRIRIHGLSKYFYLFIYLFIGSNFWKFHLITTSFTLGEPVSLVKSF